MIRKLFIVDPQNDFMDDGTLPVSGSLDRMNALASYLNELDIDYYCQIFVSLDWHPLNHCSFAAQGGPWPQHCVSFTEGALVTPKLQSALERWRLAGKVDFITKGSKPDVEEYSGVDDPQNEVLLKSLLKNTDQLDVCGVVGTVCVQNTLKGILSKGLFPAKEITVFPSFIAQFDAESEANFLSWAKGQGFQIGLKA